MFLKLNLRWILSYENLCHFNEMNVLDHLSFTWQLTMTYTIVKIIDSLSHLIHFEYNTTRKQSPGQKYQLLFQPVLM